MSVARTRQPSDAPSPWGSQSPDKSLSDRRVSPDSRPLPIAMPVRLYPIASDPACSVVGPGLTMVIRVLLAQTDRPDGAFGRLLVDGDAAIIEEKGERVPDGQSIAQGPGQIPLGGNPGAPH